MHLFTVFNEISSIIIIVTIKNKYKKIFTLVICVIRL